MRQFCCLIDTNEDPIVVVEVDCFNVPFVGPEGPVPAFIINRRRESQLRQIGDGMVGPESREIYSAM